MAATISDQILVLVDGYVEAFKGTPNRVRVGQETYRQLLDEVLSGMGPMPEAVELAIVKVHGLAVRVVKTLGVGELRVDHNRYPGYEATQATLTLGKRGNDGA